MSVAMMAAPGMTAPAVSVTRPLTVPRETCAFAVPRIRPKTQSAHTLRVRFIENMWEFLDGEESSRGWNVINDFLRTYENKNALVKDKEQDRAQSECCDWTGASLETTRARPLLRYFARFGGDISGICPNFQVA